MLAQFQARYPTGSLISELLQIYQGKFLVRVSATVEGVTRATGMAAAETLELAEDRARSRALAVLGIQPRSSTPELNDSAYSFVSQASPRKRAGGAGEAGEAGGAWGAWGGEEAEVHRESVHTDNLSEQSLPDPPAHPAPERALFPASPAPPAPERAIFMEASEPVDLSDAIAKTDVELKRLRWSPEAGRDYLIRTYNKRSRKLLSVEEMLEFLEYLESQPSPNEPFA